VGSRRGGEKAGIVDTRAAIDMAVAGFAVPAAETQAMVSRIQPSVAESSAEVAEIQATVAGIAATVAENQAAVAEPETTVAVLFRA
jgi:hypothetical protein